MVKVTKSKRASSAVLALITAGCLMTPAGAYADQVADSSNSVAGQTHMEPELDAEDIGSTNPQPSQASNGDASSGTAVQPTMASAPSKEHSGKEVPSTSPDSQDAITTFALQHKGTIKPGNYAIVAGVGNRMVLDVSGGSTANGANVQLYASNATEAQRWSVQEDEQGFLTIRSMKTDKALDVASGLGAAGANVQQWEPNGTLAQKWVAVDEGNGCISLHSALDRSLVLDISSGSSANGANVQIYSSNKTSAQQFSFVDADVEAAKGEQLIANGTYSLVSTSGAAACVDEASGEGAYIRTAQPGAAFGQAFDLQFDSATGYYSIKTITGYLLDVDLGDVVPGATVSAWGSSAEGVACRMWSVVPDASGSYKIVNAANGQLLSVGSDGGLVTVPSSDARAVAWKISKFALPVNADEIDALAQSKAESPDITVGSTYQIASSKRISAAVDVSSASTSNGAAIQLWDSNNTDAQRWVVEDAGSGYVFLKSANSGKVLDVAGGSTAPSTRVQQYDLNKTRAQKWVPVKNENGTVTFYSALGGGLVLDVTGGSTESGAALQTYRGNATAAQQFKLYDANPVVKSAGRTIADGYYQINANGAQTCLDISGASKANGAKVQVWQPNGTLAQCFKVTYGDDGFYSIQPANSAKSLDLAGGGLIPGTQIQQWACDNGNKNQRWSIVDNGSGSYSIVSARNGLAIAATGVSSGALVQSVEGGASTAGWSFSPFAASIAEGSYTVSTSLNGGQVLDVASGSVSDGANVQIYGSNSTFAQKWYVRTSAVGLLTLQNVGSGLYLAANSDGNVVQSSNPANDGAQWELRVQLGGLSLVNKANGKALDLSSANTANGSNVQTYAPNETAAQAWQFNSCELVGEGFYEIAPMTNTNLRLDVDDASLDSGRNVKVWDSNGSLAQRWWVRGAGDGWYTLTACCSAKALDVKDASAASGANVQQWDRNGSNAQKWRFEMGEEGLTIVSALGTTLDVFGGSGSRGANVDAYASNGTAAQQWRLSSAARPGKIGWQNPSNYPQVSSNTVVLPSYCNGYFTYVTPSRIAIDATREDCVNAFIARAYEYVGTKYIEPWSSWPGDAVDCSGFVLQCLYATGMDMGIYNPYNHRWLSWQTYNSMNWMNNNTFMPVSVSNIQRGDVVYYRGHIAIYLGGGKIIDSWPGQGVSVRGLYDRGAVIGAARPFV